MLNNPNIFRIGRQACGFCANTNSRYIKVRAAKLLEKITRSALYLTENRVIRVILWEKQLYLKYLRSLTNYTNF